MAVEHIKLTTTLAERQAGLKDILDARRKKIHRRTCAIARKANKKAWKEKKAKPGYGINLEKRKAERFKADQDYTEQMDEFLGL